MWILTVDGGGSKTLARLSNSSTGQQWQQQAGPASLTNDFSQAMANINLLSHSLCQQAGVDSRQLIAVMGLAGAGNPQQQQQAQQQLQRQYQQQSQCHGMGVCAAFRHVSLWLDPCFVLRLEPRFEAEKQRCQKHHTSH